MVKFSIIVPVYKTEKYIKQCIESVLNQDFENYELILVDDGSPDNSGKICDEYAKKDQRVKVIHKENAGAAQARNDGIKSAQGEYVLFADSDDFFESQILRKTNEFLKEEYDVVFLKGYKFYEDKEGEDISKNLIFDSTRKTDVLKQIASLERFPGSVWAKVIRRKLIIENNIFFESFLSAEDIDWMIKALKAARKIGALNERAYYYRQNREGSITSSVKARNVNDMFEVIKKHVVNNSEDDEQISINNILAYEYIIVLTLYSNVIEGERKKINNIFEYKWLLKYNSNPRVKLVNLISKICGIKFTSKLLNTYLKLR